MEDERGTMKDILLGIANHPAGVAAAIAVLSSFLFFFFIVSLNVSNAERKLSEQLESLSDVFASDDIPSNCNVRRFPYFYDVSDTSVDVADRRAKDWKALRSAALENQAFRSTGDQPVLVAIRPCAYSTTPHDANQILVLQRDPDTGLRSTGADFRLTFARDYRKNALYVLGHITLTAAEAPPNRLRLRLHYADLGQEGFDILLNEQGELVWNSMGFYYDPFKGDVLEDDTVGRYGSELKGAWWKSKVDGGTRYYVEFRLDGLENVSALQLFADRRTLDDSGFENIVYRIGTRMPVPLHEEMRSYQVTKYLPQRARYELYLLQGDAPFLLNSSPSAGDAGSANSIPFDEYGGTPLSRYLTGLLGMFYRFYFLVSDIGGCSIGDFYDETDMGICIRSAKSDQGATSHHLRMGKLLPPTRRGQETKAVFVEEPMRMIFLESIYSLPTAFLIIFLTVSLGYASRNRKRLLSELAGRKLELEHAHDDLHDAHQKLKGMNVELEERNADLGQINSALKQYDKTFMHEGRNQLARLMSEVESVLEVANLRSTSRHSVIKDLVSTLMKRLQDSTEIFEFRRIVREGISQYGESRFSLVDTIRDLASHFSEQGYDVQYRSLLEDHVHPELPAAGSPDPTTGVSPEYYLEQALEKVLDNAVHHGVSGAAITVSLGMEDGDAMVMVSNKGKPVDEELLAHVFDLGTQFGGAVGEPDAALQPEGPGDSHLGIGLFICRQIVVGYGGECRMDNQPDGTGVTVTVRLPCDWVQVPG